MSVLDWGSRPEERARAYPCDRFVDAPNMTLYRAISIAAPPRVVFPWLCQLRAAPYSYDWLDNFGRTSPRTRDPALEQLTVGDRVMMLFRLVDFARDEHLTLVLDKTRLFGDLALSYCVFPDGDDARVVCKIVSRVARFSPMRLLAPPGDLIMMRKQLLTLKRLAEADPSPPGLRSAG